MLRAGASCCATPTSPPSSPWVCGFILTKVGYSNIWPLFGSANQLLSALVLVTLCVFLKVTGRSNKMLFPPLIIMLCVTFTALVERADRPGQGIPGRQRHLHDGGPAADLRCAADRPGLTIVVNSLRSYFRPSTTVRPKPNRAIHF